MKKVDIFSYATDEGGIGIRIGRANLSLARWLATEVEDMAKKTGDKKEKIEWLKASCELDESIEDAVKISKDLDAKKEVDEFYNGIQEAK